MDTNAMIQLATDCAQRIGVRMREVIGEIDKPGLRFKGRTDLVTEIDLWSEEVITQAVHSAFPEHIVMGEETSNQLSEQHSKSLAGIAEDSTCWVVDPLDGTSNFVNGIPHSAVSIAVMEKGERKMGLVFDPFRDELFVAVRGQGATLNGQRISVGRKSEVIDAVITTGFPYDRITNWDRYRPSYDAFCQSARAIRRFGAASLDQCWVACGRFDGYFEYYLKPWDVAGGSIIVEEAGGIVGNFTAPREAPYSIFSDSILAAGPELYEPMWEICRANHWEKPLS